MTKRKTPAKPNAPLPRQGGSYVRNKDGSLTPEAKPEAAAQTPIPDAKPEE